MKTLAQGCAWSMVFVGNFLKRFAEPLFIGLLAMAFAKYQGAPMWGVWAVAWFSGLIVVYGVKA